MGESATCSECGNELAAGATATICPRCVFARVQLDSGIFGRGGGDSKTEFDPLTVDELTEMLPNFEIIKMIGRGGMGLVYQARQTNLDRLVAIKLLPVEAAIDPEFEDRFMREARTMAKLDHANITHIYDFGEAEGQYYIVMEYVEGQHLGHHLMSESLTPSESFTIMLQICEALAYAHSRGVVHRDIKPANIMITPEGRVKVMDFGLAKITNMSADLSSITKTNASLGTPHYMAPEQQRNLQSADHRADIYALGVLYYEMLTGTLPIGHFAPVSDKALVPAAVDSVVVKALEADVEKRYAHVNAFRDDLLIGMEGIDGTIGEKQMVVLLFTDVVDSVGLANRMGTEMYVECISRHDAIIKDVLEETTGARVLQHTGDGFLIRVGTPSEGVQAALKIQYLIANEPWPDEPLTVRIGLHLGEVIEITEQNTGVTKPVGFAINLASRVNSLAQAGQILMTRVVFDDARQYLRAHPKIVECPDSVDQVLQWPAHGRYLFQGSDEPMEIFEVGVPGIAPLSPPPDTEKVKRAVAADEEQTLGWRPGVGLDVPFRPNWVLKEKIGRGGFGEVWLAQHQKTKERRAFKFCFDPLRLRSFKRELTLFRLLRDALGKRRDIATIHEVQVEQAPFYLESDYLPGGNLSQWLEKDDRAANVPEAMRVRMVAKIARAVAAAHSVGIIHKDIKPSNVLIEEINGEPEPCLTDFGIGNIHSAQMLEDLGITHSGFTESLFVRSTGTSDSGTRLYSAPEYLVGGQPTIKGDIYALGIILYQLLVGDLHRPLGSGWRRDVADDLIADDIARCVDVDPDRRFESANALAEHLESLEDRRAAQQRQEAAAMRRRWYKVALATVGGTAAMLAVGFYQSRQAEKLALDARDDAEDTMNYLLADLYERLEPIGRLDVLNNVVDRVRAHYDQLPEELITDDILLRKSDALSKLAIIRRDQGKLEEANELLQETAAERQKLVERNPDNGEYQFEWADVLDASGVVQYRSGNFKGAEEDYRKAIRIREKLRDSGSSNPTWDNGLANVYNNLASMLQNRGRLEEARFLYEKAIATRERLIAESSSEEDRRKWSYIQSWGQNNFGWFHLRNADLDRAKMAFTSSKNYMDELIPKDLENKGYRLSRGASALGLADVELLLGNYPESHEEIAVCLRVKESLANGDPENVNWRWRLSDGYRSEGRLYMYQGDLESARSSYEEARDTIIEFAANDSANLRLQWQLAEALAGMARNRVELEHREGTVQEETIALANRAVVISEELIETDRDNTTWFLANTVCLMVDARVTQLTKGATAAIPEMRRALKQNEELNKKKYISVEAKFEHAEIAARLAELLDATGDASGAQKVRESAQPILDALHGLVPESDWYQRLRQALSGRLPVSSVLYDRPNE